MVGAYKAIMLRKDSECNKLFFNLKVKLSNDCGKFVSDSECLLFLLKSFNGGVLDGRDTTCK